MRTILAIFFIYMSHRFFPIKFPVNLPFGSGEEVQNRFLRWSPWQPSLISDLSDLSYFGFTSHPDTSFKVRVNWPFGSEEVVQNRF